MRLPYNSILVRYLPGKCKRNNISIENSTSNTFNSRINNLKLVSFLRFFKRLYVLYNLCLMENLHGVLPDPVTRFDAHTFNCVCFCIGKKPCATSMAGSIAHTPAHLYSVHCTCTAIRSGIFKLLRSLGIDPKNRFRQHL